jgi:hypothetical protein
VYTHRVRLNKKSAILKRNKNRFLPGFGMLAVLTSENGGHFATEQSRCLPWFGIMTGLSSEKGGHFENEQKAKPVFAIVWCADRWF